MDEKTYRQIMLDSSSSLKEFCLDRKKYYRKYILGEVIEEEDSKYAIMGNLVDCLLLEPEKFDGRFYISSCINAPTELMMSFINPLIKFTMEATDEYGVVHETFEERSRRAHDESDFKIKYEQLLKKFEGTDAEIYFNELLKVKSEGLTVVTANNVNIAEFIVEELKTNFVTREMINLVNSDRYTIINQLKIEGFEINGHQFKGMIDKCIIDHKEKTISGKDIKCTWNVENFYEEYYLYRRAYLQAYIYQIALQYFISTPDSPAFGYELKPFEFVVCDSNNYYNPLIYVVTDNDLNNAYAGFEYKNRRYKGVSQLIEELEWAIQYDIWNMSKENYNANGRIYLTQNYDK